MIKNHRVYYFYQAVKYGGIRNAADSLDVAPSAISRQIALLEKELKTTLLEKNLRGAIPTEAGKIVLQYFQQTLEHQDDLKASLSSLQGLERGKVIIATGEGYIRHLSKIIADFSQQYPKVAVHLNIVGSNHVVRKINENEAHIGIAFNPETNSNIRTHLAINHPLKVYCSPEHPLAYLPNALSLQELIPHAIALSDISQGIRQIIQKVENDEHIHLKPSLQCSHLHMLKQYAITGGITLLPEFMYYKEDATQLILKPLSHPYFNTIQTQIMTRRGRQLPPAALKLLQMIGKIFA